MIINFSRNPIPLVCNSAFAAQPNFRYELQAKIMNPVSGNYETVFTLKGRPASDGEYVFDVQKLHALLSPDLPAFNQSNILIGDKSLRMWRATVQEWWGTPVATLRSSYDTTPEAILMAGLSFRSWPGNNFFEQNIESYRQFLTWQPAVKTVSPEQQEYLYYLTANQSWGSIYRHGQVVFTDNSTMAIPPINTAVSDNLCIIPVGFDQMDLASLNPAKKVKKYTVWVSGTSNPAIGKSEERTYIVDHEYYKHQRYFLYQNSLGGFETLRCTGKFEDNIEVLQQEGERVLPAMYDKGSAAYFAFSTRYDYGFKANVGPLDAASKRHLIEFLISRHRYEILRDGFAPIRLLKDKEALVKDYETMPEFEFEYKYAFQNHAYDTITGY